MELKNDNDIYGKTYDEAVAHCEPYTSQSPNDGRRQTTLSEYFSESPPNKLVKQNDDNPPIKMVKFSLLMKQLFSARVVLERLPEKLVKVPSASRTTSTIGVQRYCFQCKNINNDYINVTQPKNCSNCGMILLYICEKCNESHYHRYKTLSRHRSQCKGQKTGKLLDDVCMMYCAECSFKTSHHNRMDTHMKNTGHKFLNNEKIVARKPAKPIHMNYRVEGDKIVKRSTNGSRPYFITDDQKKYIVKQSNIDFANARQRYCPNCQKVAELNSYRDDATCDTCHTILLFQCAKCRKRCTTYKTIIWHIKTKCYPSIYRCPQCNFTAPNWEGVRDHVRKSCYKSSFML